MTAEKPRSRMRPRWSSGLAVRAFAALLALVCVAAARSTPLQAHARAAMLISQSFPQVPVKPLELVSRAPVHDTLELPSSEGTVVGDLFLPTEWPATVAPHSRSALILAMGVKTAPKDRPLLLHLGDTFARMGFVVMWPRLKTLDDGVALPEEPQTFVTAVQYLQTAELVDTSRISLLGFSIGASTGLVAASRPEIADAVRSVIFFGGYYDIHTYLLSLATASVSEDGQTTAWEPSGEAVGLIREILANVDARGVLAAFEATTPHEAAVLLGNAPRQEMAQLERFSPALSSAGFKGRLFILHDTGDPLVPYVESDGLYRALSPRVETTYLVTSLFDHVQPKQEITWETLVQGFRLYGFLTEALGYV